MKNSNNHQHQSAETEKTLSVAERIAPSQPSPGFTDSVLQRIVVAESRVVHIKPHSNSLSEILLRFFTEPRYAIAAVVCILAFNIITFVALRSDRQHSHQGSTSMVNSGYESAFDDGTGLGGRAEHHGAPNTPSTPRSSP